jgi:hypothetical protein
MTCSEKEKGGRTGHQIYTSSEDALEFERGFTATLSTFRLWAVLAGLGLPSGAIEGSAVSVWEVSSPSLTSIQMLVPATDWDKPVVFLVHSSDRSI